MPEDTPTNYQPSGGSGRSLAGQLPLILALIIIGGLLLAWKPWDQASEAGDRTITVTGTAEITAEPDEYVFSPSYTFDNADQKAALAEATTKTNEIVVALKKLGVPDSKIKTDTSGYRAYYDEYQDTYYAYLTITATDKKLAQKVQDYLLTTTPTGSVSPRADFSKAKRDELTDKARDEATKEARAKADQSAKNLGFKIGKVKKVTDSPENNFFLPYASEGGRANTLAIAEDKASSAPIQAGEDELTYTVSVVYYVR